MFNTWYDMLRNEMEEQNDPGPVIKHAPNRIAFNTVFNTDYGSLRGPHVLAWTETRVYFPICYHGAEFIGSAPRNPQDDGQEHIGGL